MCLFKLCPRRCKRSYRWSSKTENTNENEFNIETIIGSFFWEESLSRAEDDFTQFPTTTSNPLQKSEPKNVNGTR